MSETDSRVADVLAAHILAIHTDRMRIVLDCGHLATPKLVLMPNWPDYAGTPGEGVTGASGYATDPATNKTMCYADADKAERERMRTSDRMFGYLSADMHITTWTGGHLGRVTSHHTSVRARKTYVQAIDQDGAKWYGVGPAESGTYVNLRRKKVA